MRAGHSTWETRLFLTANSWAAAPRGDSPASSAGKVSRVPPPAIELTAPAATAARQSQTSSQYTPPIPQTTPRPAVSEPWHVLLTAQSSNHCCTCRLPNAGPPEWISRNRRPPRQATCGAVSCNSTELMLFTAPQGKGILVAFDDSFGGDRAMAHESAFYKPCKLLCQRSLVEPRVLARARRLASGTASLGYARRAMVFTLDTAKTPRKTHTSIRHLHYLRSVNPCVRDSVDELVGPSVTLCRNSLPWTLSAKSPLPIIQNVRIENVVLGWRGFRKSFPQRGLRLIPSCQATQNRGTT